MSEKVRWRALTAPASLEQQEEQPLLERVTDFRGMGKRIHPQQGTWT